MTKSSVACALALPLLVLIAIFGMRDAIARDQDLAKFLIKHGRAELAKGKYEDAMVKFVKARREDPTMLEATYWLAQALDKRKNIQTAVREYRRFLQNVHEATLAGVVRKEDKKLLSKARSRLKSLDRVGVAIDGIHAKFADALCAAAKDKMKSDAGFALHAMKWAQSVAPTHTASATMLKEIESRRGPRTPAFDTITRWRDLLASHYFGRNDGWTYKGPEVEIHAQGGAQVKSPKPIRSGTSYGVTVDVELLAFLNDAKTSVFGITFAVSEDEALGALFIHNKGKQDRVALSHIDLRSKKDRPIKVLNMEPWKPGIPRRISVRVVGKSVEVFLNDKSVMRESIESMSSLQGSIGITYQNARFRLTKFKFGMEIAEDKK